jgi:hypothetical protein
LQRNAAVVAAAAMCTVIAASIASARRSAGIGTTGGGSTLSICGFGPDDDVANGRAAIATRALGGAEVVAVDRPVVGAALAGLDALGAPAAAGERLRRAFREGLVPEHVA